MNAALSLASLKSPPPLPGTGAQIQPVNKGFNDAFGQLLEHATLPGPDRNSTQAKLERGQLKRSEVREPHELDERTDRARARVKTRQTDQDQNLAGAVGVAAPPATIENTRATPTQTQSPAPETLTPAEPQSSNTSETQVEHELSVEDGAEITSEKTLTTTPESLVESLTPVLKEVATQISEAGPTGLAKAMEATNLNTESQEELLSQTSTGPLMDDPLENTALALATGSAAPEPDDVRRVARAVRRAQIEAIESPRGIATAQMSQVMKSTIKKDQAAGRTEQILPGSQNIAVPPLPKLAGEPDISGTLEVSAEDIAAAKLSPLPARSDVSETHTTEARPLAPMGRIGDIITREVRMFRHAADDLVEVVLTPDAKTQISLRLQWRDGQVEAQARCDFGDHKALNTQWPQLQTALAGQGVRLSHLSERVQTGFTDFFNNSGFAQSHGGDRQPPSPRTLRENGTITPGPGSIKPAATKPAHARRLLESWA